MRLISIISIAAITAVEALALHHGVNGHGLTASIAAIGGVAGYQIGRNGNKRKNR